MLTPSLRPHVVIVQPGPAGPSETFLRGQAEHLPARVTVVYGGLPVIDGRPLRSPALPARAWRKAVRLLRGRSWEDECTAAYAEAFRRLRPGVVLAQYGDTGLSVLDACRRTGSPLVVHFHGYDASRRDCVEGLADGYRRMFHEAAAVVGVSRAMCDRLRALGAPPEKLHCIPCGVDLGAFGGADPASAPPVFLAVGRFIEKKAPHLTIEAFARVWRGRPDARLRMIGDGPLRGPCEGLVRQLGAASAVTFLGFQPSAVVQEEMRRARAFVQHSIEAADGDCEGTPVAVLEAGATGLPVVATRHAGIPDAVVHGTTGLLVAERDVAGMADHMLALTDDPVRAGRLGRAARQWVTQEFNRERSIDRLWAVLAASLRAPKVESLAGV